MFSPVPAAESRGRDAPGAACRCGPGWPYPRDHVPFLRLSVMAAARHEKKPGAPAVRPAMHAMRDARLRCPAKVIEVKKRPVGMGRREYFRSGGQGLAGRNGHGAFGTRGGKGHGSRNRSPARVGGVLRRTKGGVERGGHGGPRCGAVFGAGGHAVPAYVVGARSMALPCLPCRRPLRGHLFALSGRGARGGCGGAREWRYRQRKCHPAGWRRE